MGMNKKNLHVILGALAEGVQAETRQALINMGEILKASGSSLDKVLKTTVFLRDMNDFNAVNEVYATVRWKKKEQKKFV